MPPPDVEDDDARAFELLRQIVALCNESWLTRERFLQLAALWSGDALADRIRFLTELRRMLGDLPVQIFPDMDARQALLTALQDALDELINREEEQEG